MNAVNVRVEISLGSRVLVIHHHTACQKNEASDIIARCFRDAANAVENQALGDNRAGYLAGRVEVEITEFRVV